MSPRPHGEHFRCVVCKRPVSPHRQRCGADTRSPACTRQLTRAGLLPVPGIHPPSRGTMTPKYIPE